MPSSVHQTKAGFTEWFSCVLPALQIFSLRNSHLPFNNTGIALYINKYCYVNFMFLIVVCIFRYGFWSTFGIEMNDVPRVDFGEMFYLNFIFSTHFVRV